MATMRYGIQTLACAAVGISVFSAPANADSKIILKSWAAGRVLEIPGDWTGYLTGTQAQMWDEAQKPLQTWLLTPQPSISGGANTYVLANTGSGQCLQIVEADVASQTNSNGDGAPVVGQWDCKSAHDSRDDQLWIIEPRAGATQQWEAVTIRNVKSNTCLDAVCYDNGDKLQHASCNGSNSQYWTVRPSRIQLIEDCGTMTDQCHLQLVEEPRKYWGPPQVVSAESLGYINCTKNLEEIEVTHTKSYTRALNFNISASAASSFATAWNSTIGVTFDLLWSWTDADSFRQKMLLSPGEMGQLEYTPQILHTKSRMVLNYSRPLYDHYQWIVPDLEADLPIAGTGANVARTVPANPPCSLIPRVDTTKPDQAEILEPIQPGDLIPLAQN